MFINPTFDKLRAMRLQHLARILERQMEDPAVVQLSFEERLSLLVDQLWVERENRGLTRRLQNAHLKLEACLEDWDYGPARGLDRALARSLSTSQWVRAHHNLLIVGPCGVGKTYLACAFAQRAIRDGFTALYARASRLFRDLAVARADGSLDKLWSQLVRVDVLVVDDWAMAALAESERRDFREICEDRYLARSTVLASQMPVACWHEQIGDPTLADAILDRLVHNAYRIELKGGSMRKHLGLPGADQPADPSDSPGGKS
jgi:DNA replication protein DnaC